MQAVVFHVGKERFAIDTKSIAEVIPCIPARPVPAAPNAILGVIEYRGDVIPVLDLCRLFRAEDCPIRLSNRILVCNLPTPGGDGTGRSQLGILAENVTRVTTLDPDAPGAHPGPDTPGIRGLGKILQDATGLVQLVYVEELIPAEVLAALVREARA
jgi:chemotaxis-related protein WspB